MGTKLHRKTDNHVPEYPVSFLSRTVFRCFENRRFQRNVLDPVTQYWVPGDRNPEPHYCETSKLAKAEAVINGVSLTQSGVNFKVGMLVRKDEKE